MRILALTALSVILIARGVAAAPEFSPAAWAAAPKAGAGWSRVELVTPFCTAHPAGEKLARARVLELLGAPALSLEHDPGTKGRTRTDVWMVAASNRQSFEIRYDASDRVAGYTLGAACLDRLAPGPAGPEETLAKADDATLAKLGPQTTFASARKLFGQPARQQASDDRVGGQHWHTVAAAWRLSADGRESLVASFSRPSREAGPPDDELPLRGLVRKTASADCPRR